MLGKSLRTVASISSRLREDFFAPEEAHGLPRRIEFHLSSGRLTLAQLMERMGPGAPGGSTVVGREAIEQALGALLEEGRVVRQPQEGGGPDTFGVASLYANLVRRNLARRIDGLNHLEEAVLDTVIARFFKEDEQAFARTLTFAAPPEGVGELRQQVYDMLRLRTNDLEELAAEQGIGDKRYHIVFCVTPVSEDTP